ncbi:nucleotide-diphospho-sugar transferase [Phascolomyces articulosus]|uniref:Nucleotide-diphospho-sugar transferase n=1 Tax=Phascolomyces articulosus TaxID=60185 RepID=A0AAD5PFR6_9FUNG|nr:nucleotide-diphospho-sugar transferase [Phascolomyces articulosus]
MIYAPKNFPNNKQTKTTTYLTLSIVLILGAGYGTRLQRDLHASSDYKHLLGVPKALLPLGGRDALITHWLDLFRSHNINDIYVVTNAATYDAFVSWAERNQVRQENIVSDGTLTNETRLGAVPDIAFGIHHFGLEQDSVLVVGGDTLFLSDFQLQDLLAQVTPGSCLVTTYAVPDSEVHKFGIVETDQEGIMTSFLEKPNPKETTSRLACPCFYLFDKQALPLLDAFVEEFKGQPKETFDATGKFLAYLYPRFKVKTFPISGRIDVGGLKSYIDANAYFA